RPSGIVRLAALARRRVLDEAVYVPAFMILRQILGDRHPLRRHEEEAVAILPLLHLVARTDPAPAMLAQLRFLVGVEVARTERPTHLLDIRGEAEHDRLRRLGIGMAARARLDAVLVDVPRHLRDALRRRFGTLHRVVAPAVEGRTSPS